MQVARKPLPTRRFLVALFATAWSIFAVVLIAHGVPDGLPLSNDYSDFFIDPSRVVEQWAYLWDPTMFLGQEIGNSQALLPAAIFYSSLAHLHLVGAVALRVYLSLIVLTSFWSFLIFAHALRRELPLSDSSLIVSSAFYSANLFVLAFLPKIPSALWIYALLPLAVVCAYEAITRSRPFSYAAIVGLLSVVEIGANGAMVIIAAFCWLSFAVFFALSGPERKGRMKAAIIFVVLTGIMVLAVNAYWIGPFVQQIPRTWLGGVFSEGSSWHSATGNIFDVMRLSNGNELTGSDESGPFFVFGHAYVGISAASIAMLALPVAALSAFLFPGIRKLRIARFSLVLFCFAAVMGSGSYPGAWFGSLWSLAYDQVSFFQVFRSIAKWDIVVAFCLSLFLGMAITAVTQQRGIIRRMPLPVLAWSAFGCMLLLQVIALSPILHDGLIPQRQLVNVPAYWSSASEALQLPIDFRTLTVPEEYLPKFFWGDVGSDFPQPFIKRRTAFLIANGTVAPSADSSIILRAAYSGLASDATWATPLLQRLSVGKIINERDAYYYTEEQGKSDPQTVSTELAGTFAKANSIGLVDAYSVPNPLPFTRSVSLWASSMADQSLYGLFPLLDRRTSVEELTPQGYLSHKEVPIITAAGGLIDAAVSVTAPLAQYQSGPGSHVLTLPRDTNIDIFVRDRLNFQTTPSIAITLDGRVFEGERSTDWMRIAAVRLGQGDHAISSTGGPLDTKITSDADLQRSMLSLQQNRNVGKYLAGIRTAQQFWLQPGEYALRATREPSLSAWSIPLSFSPRETFQSARGCTEIPSLLLGSSYEEPLQAPRTQWYASPGSWQFAVNGRVTLQAFGPTSKLAVLNPTSQAARVSIHGAFEPLGGDRTLKLLTSEGVAQEITLSSRADELTFGLQDLLSAPISRFYFGPTRASIFQTIVKPGLSEMPILASGGFGIPEPASSNSDFLLWDAVGSTTATVCGDRISGKFRSVTGSQSRIQFQAGFQPVTSAIPVMSPYISLDTLPSITVPILYSNGGFGIHVFFNYVDRGGQHWRSAQLQKISNGEYEFSLRPSDGAEAHGMLLSLLVVVDVAESHMLALGAPNMNLQRTRWMRYSGAGSPRLLQSRRIFLPRSGTEKSLTKLYFPANSPTFDKNDLQLRTSGLYIGVSYELHLPTFSLLNSQAQQLTFKLPLSLSPVQQQLWRRRVRLFHGSEEIPPSPYAEVAPFSFSVSEDSIIVDQPIERSDDKRWSVLVLPDSWVEHDAALPDQELFSIPMRSGATDLRSNGEPVPTFIDLVPVFDPASSTMPPPSIGAPSYQIATGRSSGPDRGAPPQVEVDGNPVRSTWSLRNHWWTSVLHLSGFSHTMRDIGEGPGDVAAVLLPRGAERVKGVACSGPHIVSETPVQIDVEFSQSPCGSALVNNQMYDDGWVAQDQNGNKLAHVKIDGYANGFHLDQQTRRVFLRFSPQPLLVLSRFISIFSIALLCILALGALTHTRYDRN